MVGDSAKISTNREKDPKFIMTTNKTSLDLNLHTTLWPIVIML